MLMGALYDHDAERAVLGGVLMEPKALDGVVDTLRAEHFHHELNRRIFGAMLSLQERGESPDLLLLRSELNLSGNDVAYLAGLTDGMPRVLSVDTWAGEVRAKARRRSVLHIAQRLVEEAESEEAETDEMLDRHQSAILRLIESANGRHTVPMSEVAMEALDDLSSYAQSKTGITGVPSGLPSLDNLLSGFQPGTLNIVAGRPGHGKSVLCGQVSVWAASKGHRVLAFTLEMPPRSVAQRMILSAAEVEKWDLPNHKPTSQTAWRKVTGAYERLLGLPLWFNGLESPTLVQIRSAAKRQQAAGGLDLVVVDYIQRCNVDRKVDRWIALGDLARGLKSLAMALRVPVLVAAQLNREAAHRKPTMADIREAGDIEQEADVIMLLHPEQSIPDHDFPQVNLIVEKHRAGQTMPLTLSFEKAYARFVEIAKEPAA